MENFVCTKCGKKCHVNKYSSVIRENRTLYFTDRNLHTQLKCECNELLELIPKEVDWDKGAPTFARFSSLTPDQKKKVLLKRSHEHFEREIKEQKHVMEKATFGTSEYDKKK